MPDAAGRPRFDVRVFASLASTNTTLKELAAAGASEGTVVVAEAQTGGRGRHGRSWHSPEGAGLYASILVRPEAPPEAIPSLTFVAAIAVAEALEALGVASVEIKWPNDVLVRGRKVCGILTEASFLNNRVEWAVVGVGVNLRRDGVPDELRDRATSLDEEGASVAALELLGRLLDGFGRWYAAFVERGPAGVLARWAELAPMAEGRAVTVDDGREAYEGVTEGVTPDGRLRVRRGDGRLEAVAAADVTLRAQ
jgi:BirA family biotin operon repressor/biotin-[acetyl-CoA-carboxylase] ligase